VRRASSPDAPYKLSKELEGLRHLDEYEVAALPGFAVASLRNWRCQARGPSYVKMGRSVRYRLKDVLEWIESHRVKPRG
jgi:predicted DNA-binding transcriptional regulator AlpA